MSRLDEIREEMNRCFYSEDPLDVVECSDVQWLIAEVERYEALMCVDGPLIDESLRLKAEVERLEWVQQDLVNSNNHLRSGAVAVENTQLRAEVERLRWFEKQCKKRLFVFGDSDLDKERVCCWCGSSEPAPHKPDCEYMAHCKKEEI